MWIDRNKTLEVNVQNTCLKTVFKLFDNFLCVFCLLVLLCFYIRNGVNRKILEFVTIS